jgi:phospholipid/cholesterol/gamma-HCH transport system permease protein
LSHDPATTFAAPRAFGPLRVLEPLAAVIGYLGGVGLLAVSTLGALARPRGLLGTVVRRLDALFLLGLPMVALMHVGVGSFLSMQAYFGATFTEANGAVVGLGLMRNVAPLLTGYILAGLFAVWITGELSGGLHPGIDAHPADLPDRDVALGRADDPRTPPTAGRVALVRILAAMVAGPILVACGAAVGTAIGALVIQKMLGLPIGIFFGLMRQMLQAPDALGVVVKGMAYPAVSSLIACHEGLRAAERRRLGLGGAPPAFRAMMLSVLAILSINLFWFTMAYLAGNPFGPSVVAADG